MYRYNKTSIILKISIAVLFIIGMVLECSCERSEEPEKRGTGYGTGETSLLYLPVGGRADDTDGWERQWHHPVLTTG